MLRLAAVAYPPILPALNASIQSGQGVWLKGPNGAGKTTLLKIIAGLLPPESGQVLWHDKAIQGQLRMYQSCVGYIGHRLGLPHCVSVGQHLTWLESMQCHANAAHPALEPGSHPVSHLVFKDAVTALGLDKLTYQAIHTLSAGQKRRLALLPLWCVSKPLWLLDEPFTALDQHMHAALSAQLKQQIASGATIIMTSHHSHEVCDTFEIFELGGVK